MKGVGTRGRFLTSVTVTLPGFHPVITSVPPVRGTSVQLPLSLKGVCPEHKQNLRVRRTKIPKPKCRSFKTRLTFSAPERDHHGPRPHRAPVRPTNHSTNIERDGCETWWNMGGDRSPLPGGCVRPLPTSAFHS